MRVRRALHAGESVQTSRPTDGYPASQRSGLSVKVASLQLAVAPVYDRRSCFFNGFAAFWRAGSSGAAAAIGSSSNLLTRDAQL
jgi:hypothetical protein